ncbi:unnamed protein product [Rotaria socialis]|uniref:Uncharacterized protein n=1 Tax=Rotaria socialis TaxID=392032 RepID=A0A821T5F4_9BILA|nr:unnamed protein product [Rotaria socialis]CAF4866897.1 unnamed protein product [Rotaria socialis]
MATSHLTNNVVEKKWNGLPRFVGPFSHRLMGFQLPRLVEQSVPSQVAKSEVRVHIKVDVDTKGKSQANNGPILIVDRRSQQHQLPLFGVGDQDDSDDSLRWQSYDEYYDDGDEEADDFRSDEQKYEDSESDQVIHELFLTVEKANRANLFFQESHQRCCVEDELVALQQQWNQQRREIVDLSRQIDIFREISRNICVACDSLLGVLNHFHEHLQQVHHDSKMICD